MRGRDERNGDSMLSSFQPPKIPSLAMMRWGGRLTSRVWSPGSIRTLVLCPGARERHKQEKKERERREAKRGGGGRGHVVGVSAPEDPLSCDDKAGGGGGEGSHSRLCFRVHPSRRSVPLAEMERTSTFLSLLLLLFGSGQGGRQIQIPNRPIFNPNPNPQSRCQGCLAPRISGPREPMSVKLRRGVCGTMPPRLHQKTRCSCVVG